MTEQVNSFNRFLLGLFAAITSSFFIGASLVLQKKALSRNANGRSRKTKFSRLICLFDSLWLFGVLMMGVGECFNFVAYAFAPASLVAPLGALSVLVAALLSAKFLNESLNLLSWCGCFACIIGAVGVVIHSTASARRLSLQEFVDCSKSSAFLCFCLITFVCIFLMISIGPRYGSRNILVYISVCSLIGGYTVPACKGLAIAFEHFSSNMSGALTVIVVCAVTLLVCCSAQLLYLNKALSNFEASIVTPIYYAFFTSSVVVSTGIFFREFVSISSVDCIGGICGFLNILLGTFLMQMFKDAPFTFDHMKKIINHKQIANENYDQENLL